MLEEAKDTFEFAKNTILFNQIFNKLLLTLIDPAGDRYDKK